MPRILPLDSMRPGEEGRIVDVAGRPEMVHRLEEMGFQADVVVRMVNAGSPCIVALGDHRYGLRGDEIAALLVELDD